jgi:hypothetical protein
VHAPWLVLINILVEFAVGRQDEAMPGKRHRRLFDFAAAVRFQVRLKFRLSLPKGWESNGQTPDTRLPNSCGTWTGLSCHEERLRGFTPRQFRSSFAAGPPGFRPSLGFLGFNCVDNAFELSLFVRVLGASLKRVGTAHQDRVYAGGLLESTAHNMRLHPIIIGGGIAGLCLGKGLRKARIGIAVYEKRAQTLSGGSSALRDADLLYLQLGEKRAAGPVPPSW